MIISFVFHSHEEDIVYYVFISIPLELTTYVKRILLVVDIFSSHNTCHKVQVVPES